MDLNVLKDAIQKRKAKRELNLDLTEEKDETLDPSEQVDEVTEVTMGEGPSKQNMKDAGHKSSDELLPNMKELVGKPFKDAKKNDDGGMDGLHEEKEKVGADSKGSADEAVFDEREYKRAKNKKKHSLYERVQMNIGDRLKK